MAGGETNARPRVRRFRVGLAEEPARPGALVDILRHDRGIEGLVLRKQIGRQGRGRRDGGSGAEPGAGGMSEEEPEERGGPAGDHGCTLAVPRRL